MAAASSVPVQPAKRASHSRSVTSTGWFKQATKPAAAGVPLGFSSVMCCKSFICMRLHRREAERSKESTESSRKNSWCDKHLAAKLKLNSAGIFQVEDLIMNQGC